MKHHLSRLGMTLGTTLLVVALVTTLGLALANMAVTHLSLMNRSSNRLQAKNLANSAIARAIEKLAQDDTYGRGGLPAETLSAVHLSAPDGAVGLLTFNPAEASAQGLPLSVNNLRGNGSIAGHQNRVIPAAAAHLVAVGRCRGIEKRVEAILHIPPFPYAIASSVPIRSSGGLLVAGVDNPSNLLDVVNNGQDDPAAVPADLATNATSDQAMVLSGDTVIAGDAQAAGGIEVDPNGGTQILGEMRSHAEPTSIPKIEVDDYDPQLTGRVYVDLSSVPKSPVFEGTVRHQGDLSIDGGMTLDGAVLFVDGNLTVVGGVQGDGGIVVKGATTLVGGSNVASEDLVALISQGDIVLRGVGAEASFFQGLVYTEGSFFADQVTLLGTLIANPPEGSAEVFLKDANLIYNPEYSEVTVTESTDSVELHFNRAGFLSYGLFRETSLTVTLSPSGTFFIDGTDTGVTTIPELADKLLEEVERITGRPPSPIAVALTRRRLPRRLRKLSPVNNPGTPQPAAEIFTAQPSQFLNLADSMRVVLWREL